MPTLVFSNANRALSWPALGLKWPARSGPWGEGELPAGRYLIGRREIVPYSSGMPEGFRNGSGQGYFVPIYPTFPTHRGRDGRLGIHPDGNKPGTRGCIGIQREYAKDFYEHIVKTPINANLTLEVR